MKKQVEITLFGAKGKRTLNIMTRGGFFTRHIKAPREKVSPSKPAPAPPKPVPESPSLLEVLKYMEASENHKGGLIIDEILFGRDDPVPNEIQSGVPTGCPTRTLPAGVLRYTG